MTSGWRCARHRWGLLASPVSWQHHFVWIVPLAMSLAERGRGDSGAPRLPGLVAESWLGLRGLGDRHDLSDLGVALARSPFRRLPNGADLELYWTWFSTCALR